MQLSLITEKEVVRQVKEVIKQTGLEIQRLNTGCFQRAGRFVRTAKKGTLDFEGYDNTGRFVAIECKRPVGGRLSPEQAERIRDILHKGGVAGVVHSGEETMELLRSFGCI